MFFIHFSPPPIILQYAIVFNAIILQYKLLLSSFLIPQKQIKPLIPRRLNINKKAYGTGNAKRDCMRIAVSYLQNRIAPVFDVSENILLLDLEDRGEKKRESISIVRDGIFEKAKRLSELRVAVLICGAISGIQERAVKSAGIEVVGFVCGEIEGVLSAFLDGSLEERDFAMPGYSPSSNRRRRHAWRGGKGKIRNF
jgi:predicted Fe-Mo cluster-binding NifX family protein